MKIHVRIQMFDKPYFINVLMNYLQSIVGNIEQRLVLYICGGSILDYPAIPTPSCRIDKLKPRQIGHHFADDIFECILLQENVWIPIKIFLAFAPKCPINDIPALCQIMAWCRPGGKPWSEPMMVSLPTHLCVTRPPWVNRVFFM